MKRIFQICLLFTFSSSMLFSDSNLDLLESAGNGNLEGVKKSLVAKANINFADKDGTSALMFAANNNHFQVVKYLVDNNADVLARNTSGWTASIMAGVRGNTFIKEYLEGVEKKIPKNRVSGIVLKMVGEAFIDNRKLKIGDIVSENQTVFVAKNSFCDLKVKQSLSEVLLRLKGNTVFSLQYKEEPNSNVFSGLLKHGSAFFKVGNVVGGEKIQVATPTNVASVRGTAYEVNVDPEKKAKISVYEGVVRSRIRATEIEENESLDNHPEVNKLIKNLDGNAQNVSVGHFVEVSPKNQEKILEKAEANKIKKSALGDEAFAAPTGLSLRCSDKPVIKKMEPNDLIAGQKEMLEIGVTE